MVIGNWIVQVTPHMEDMLWREALLRATQTYERWLMAPPMERLAVEPEVPFEFEQGLWARIERRGALALLKALPESIKVRAGVDEVHGIDCNLIGNFPHLSAWRFGGANSETLAERGGEVGNSLRTWRRACAFG